MTKYIFKSNFTTYNRVVTYKLTKQKFSFVTRYITFIQYSVSIDQFGMIFAIFISEFGGVNRIVFLYSRTLSGPKDLNHVFAFVIFVLHFYAQFHIICISCIFRK